MKNMIAIAGLALAGIAGSANAALVSVSGGITVPITGSSSPLSPNTTTGITFSGSSQDATVTGLVAASTSVVGSNQAINLRLTNFNFTSTSLNRVVIDVTITQDYIIQAPGAFATGSHQLNGNTIGSRNGNIVVTSMHESTNLPVLNVAFTGPTDPLTAEQGQTTTVSPIDGVYTITTTYRFTIEGGAASGSIILPDSGHDDALLVLVPLPTAAYSGIGGLALAGAAFGVRRRNHKA